MSAASWQRRYSARLWISDTLVLIWVVYGTQIIWFGTGNAQLAISRDIRLSDISYWLASAILIAIWLWALSLADSRSYRVIGVGTTEYVRVVDASLRVFGGIAIVAFLVRIDIARGYLLISFPVGILMLLLVRWLWRQWLVAKRQAGQCMSRVLLVGSADSVAQVGLELGRRRSAGYTVVGACLPGEFRGGGPGAQERGAGMIPGTDIRILGGIDDLPEALRTTGADTVAITSSDDLPPDKVKQISWSLEAGQQHLVLAPSIADIAGPRIHMRPVAGLPLVHVETPRFSLGQRIGKRATDLILGILTVVILIPVLIAIAIAVRMSSPGPVLFRQTRIGYGGRTLSVPRFRTMTTAPEQTVTRVGTFLRRHRLDSLPQLLTVILGAMSLVGPRAPLPAEVEGHDDHVYRRFLVKPGVTGPWRIGDGAGLSWEESVRLDLAYVENWSFTGDLAILAKSAKAALFP